MDHSFVLRPGVPGAQGRLQAMRGSDPPSPPVAKEALDVPLGHGCCGPGLWELWKTAALVDSLPLPKMFLTDWSLWDKLSKKGSVDWGRPGAPHSVDPARHATMVLVANISGYLVVFDPHRQGCFADVRH